jgi:hypothetical protein
MKRSTLIALLGLVLALGGGAGVYLSRVASYRALCAQAGVELAWIKMEFNLNDADFARVRQLHEAYKPVCETMSAASTSRTGNWRGCWWFPPL